MASSTNERVISQVGDSTDGEDYELEEDEKDFVENKLNKECSGKKYSGDIYWVTQYGRKTFNYSISCKLKTLGYHLLNNPKVKLEYKKIKSTFIDPQVKKEFLKFDKILGRGWSTVVKHYDLTGGSNEVFFRRFYKINQTKIDNFFIENEAKDFDGMSDSTKVENYLKEKAVEIGIDTNQADWMKNFFISIQLLHVKTADVSLNRENTKYLLFSKEFPDASQFLARVKADLKLDKDLVKFHLFQKKLENPAFTNKMIFDSQEGESIDIYPDGKFMVWNRGVGKYSELEEKLRNLLSNGAIEPAQIKEFIKLALRGKLDDSIVINRNFEEEAMEVLIQAVELIFGVEGKRNFAAFVTAPMFFDLVDAERYKIEAMSITKKLPMAINGAVKASVIIDEIMGRPSRYDFSGAFINPPNQDVLKLRKAENELVQDWVKLKMNKPRSSSNVESFDAGLLYELFKDWYGVELSQLRTGNIILEPGS